MKSRVVSLFISLLTVLALTGPGCFLTSDSSKPSSDSDPNSALSRSIISLPSSLSPSQGGIKKIATRESGGNSMAGIYSGVTNYISMAEMFKDLVKDIMLHLVNSQILEESNWGVLQTIPEDPSDPGAPYALQVDRTTGETYDWKISLYFTSTSTSPEMIVRFSIVNNTAKGRILWSLSEEDEDLAAIGISITRSMSVDVAFDGTASKKTLEVRFIQDLTPLLNYANANWGSLSSSEKDALDLGQPAKVFVNAEYESGVFTIYGTSYHPLWDDEATLRGDDMMWGEANRNIYMFKAKAIEGATGGAKLYLALPLSTSSDVSSSWVDDSIGNIFAAQMLSQLNSQIGAYADTSIDADVSMTPLQEQQNAFYILNWMLESGIYSAYGLTDHSGFSGTFTAGQFTNAQAFWPSGSGYATYFNTDITGGGIDVADLQAYYDASSEADKANIYLATMAPEIISAFNALYNGGSGQGITQAQLEAFVNSTQTDPNVISFQDQYKSIKSMINPAFFSEASGFLGTYDETAGTFYQFVNGLLVESSDQSSISDLLNNSLLDLSGITMYVPTEVVNATITVE